MNATIKLSGKKGVITLEGGLTLPHGEVLKGIFLKALQTSDDVTIAMENVHNAELSCLQLFCSSERGTRKKTSGVPRQSAAGSQNRGGGCSVCPLERVQVGLRRDLSMDGGGRQP